MAVIIDMDMPKGCWGCKFIKANKHKTNKCILLGEKFDDRLDYLTSRYEDCPLKEADKIIKSQKKEPTLDKIRTEIEIWHKEGTNWSDIRLMKIEDILDKYKAESE